MARNRMTNKRLSELMSVHVNTISYWKNQDSLPQIGGEALNSLCKYLECTPFDLIEYTLMRSRTIKPKKAERIIFDADVCFTVR